MASVELQSGRFLLHGKLGNMIFRRWGDKIVVSAAPDYSKRKASAKQTAGRQQFKQAAAVAKQRLQDPAWKAACQRLAEERHWPLWNAAISLARNQT